MYIITEKDSNILIAISDEVILNEDSTFTDVTNSAVYFNGEYSVFEPEEVPRYVSTYEYTYTPETGFKRFLTAQEVLEQRMALKQAATLSLTALEDLDTKISQLNSIVKNEVDTDSMTLDEYRQYKQACNKKMLADFLEAHPLLWTDGFYYGVTEKDQNEMLADKTAYDFKHSIGQTDWTLQWHSVKSACRDFSEEEFAALLNAIVDYVYPYRQLEMYYKEKIYSATVREALEEITLIYSEAQIGRMEDTNE